MATAQLTATPRTDAGKGVARKLRAAGNIPAVIYGHSRESQPLSIATRDVEKLLDRVSFETTVIELDIGGKVARTLIREIQRHPYRRQILHIDFQELVAGEKVTVNVPLVLVGTPEGVRLSGGVLDQVMREVSVRVDPGNIPNHIDVDVSNVPLGHSLHISDLVVPEGVEVLDAPEETVVVVATPRAVVEETAAAATEEVDTTGEPELIRKTKDEEDAEEAK
jgi:large subunit ribosomal protein L25